MISNCIFCPKGNIEIVETKDGNMFHCKNCNTWFKIKEKNEGETNDGKNNNSGLSRGSDQSL